ncbi:MAG: hypothetical protein K6F53_00020 [Lachnospiraceae bacterium]|nr:hypothetical protein [Lachnospiraceae bacterium]
MKRRMRRMLGLMTVAGMLITAFPTASYAEIPEEQDKSVFEGSELTEDPVPADPGNEMSGTVPELSGQVEDEISDDVPEGIETEGIETEGIETEGI